MSKNKKCKNCGYEFEKAVHVGSKEVYSPDGTPELATLYGCPKCKQVVSTIVYGDQ